MLCGDIGGKPWVFEPFEKRPGRADSETARKPGAVRARARAAVQVGERCSELMKLQVAEARRRASAYQVRPHGARLQPE